MAKFDVYMALAEGTSIKQVIAYPKNNPPFFRLYAKKRHLIKNMPLIRNRARFLGLKRIQIAIRADRSFYILTIPCPVARSIFRVFL